MCLKCGTAYANYLILAYEYLFISLSDAIMWFKKLQTPNKKVLRMATIFDQGHIQCFTMSEFIHMYVLYDQIYLVNTLLTSIFLMKTKTNTKVFITDADLNPQHR